jgi:hypothetical protein
MMTSAAKIAANRRNAQRSTGPRSAAAKARVSRNALRHGLASRKGQPDQAVAEQIEVLARDFAAGSGHPVEQELAHRAADAQFEIVRLRRRKIDLVNRAATKRPQTTTANSGSKHGHAAVAFAQKSKTLAAFDRYERRALSKRDRALRALRLHRAARLREPAELVGPPRPQDRTRSNLFIDSPVRLELSAILSALMLDPSKVRQRPFHEVYTLSIGADLPITVVVRLDGQAGTLRVNFAPHGHTLAQEFPIEGRTYGVGGTRWHIRCPETKKLVRELYWVASAGQFRSRHALKLVYRSRRAAAIDRHFARIGKLMDRIGATDRMFPPPRPKYMRRRTYNGFGARSKGKTCADA